jgi:LDH2 family malate/lactate/ureidoglycolate dehydrogenase
MTDVTGKLLDEDQDDKVRLSVDEAQALGERALRGAGFSAEESRIVTEHLVDASTWGFEFAGLPRILVISERPELGKPLTPISIIRQSPVSAFLDGGNHIGYVTLLQAADIAIEKARTSGVAVVGMRNSWVGGRNGYYLEKIARAGLVGIYMGSSTPTVVPPGAARKALGTNPFTIALPRDGNPYIYDIGTAAVMSGEMLMRAFLGQSFEEEVGIDGSGKPTRVARDLVQGGVYPFGGHKGFGLSLTIQALGLMVGSKFRNGEVADFGFLMIAFDPELFMPLGQFTTELEELLQMIQGLPRQEGVPAIRIPSERGFHERAIRREQGILVSRKVVERLQSM